MKARCQSPTNTAYAGYGGRGVRVCATWQQFIPFLDWALANGYADDREIDRINSDGPYSPANCRWVSKSINIARQALDREGAYLSRLDGRLTPEQVSDAAPSQRPYKLYDGDGLYLRITPSGHRVWRLRFRFANREQLLTIGSYPALALRDARELAAVARSRIEQGRNPAQIRRETRARQERRHRSKVGEIEP
jgi:hypothetical protein